MKFTIDQPAAAAIISMMAGIPSPRSQAAINTCIRIVAVKGAATFHATDFERYVRQTVAVTNVAQPGEVCLPAKRLADCIKLMDAAEPIVITSTTEGAELRSGKSKYSVRGHDPKDFPAAVAFEEKNAFNLTAASVKKMAAMVSFAIATEKTRYSLNGVLLEVKANEVVMVGSDGKRLAMISHRQGIGRDFPNAIIPIKGVELLTWIASTAVEIEVELRANQLLARTPNALISTQLVAGLYPNFRQVLPDESKLGKRAVIGRESFLKNLQRTRVFTNDQSLSARFEFAKNKLTMSARSAEDGEPEVESEIVYNDPNLTIGFDPKILVDVLRALESDDVVVMLNDADTTAVIKQDVDGHQYYYLAMPTDLGEAEPEPVGAGKSAKSA